MRLKKRSDLVREEDRGKVVLVHNGKIYMKRRVGNDIYLGLRWGERVKTRKPCRTGANRRLRKKAKPVKKKK
jgi:ribosomal protein S19